MHNNPRCILRYSCIALVFTALLPAIAQAGDFHTPPYKLDRPLSPPYTHLQLDNHRNGLAVLVESPTNAVVYRIDPNGTARRLTRIEGRIESVQVNARNDRACVYVKEAGDTGAMSRWYFSTSGEGWVLRDPHFRFLELDALPDGRVLLAEKLDQGVALQLRSAEGVELGRIVLTGETFRSGTGDSAGNPLHRFALLRDGSGVIERGQADRTEGSERSAIVTRFWSGETQRNWVPGVVLGLHGFDRDRIFVQTEGDHLFVTAAGGAPHPVDLHGQTVRGLAWAGDGTLRMTHGDTAFVAESYLHASGQAKAQWVRPRKALAAGLGRSALGPHLARLDRGGALSGQSWWSGSVRSSYLSDAQAADASIIVALDSAKDFSPEAYPWPDGVAYSPDMRWMLRMQPSGDYAITPARAMNSADALAMLKKFDP